MPLCGMLLLLRCGGASSCTLEAKIARHNGTTKGSARTMKYAAVHQVNAQQRSACADEARLRFCREWKSCTCNRYREMRRLYITRRRPGPHNALYTLVRYADMAGAAVASALAIPPSKVIHHAR